MIILSRKARFARERVVTILLLLLIVRLITGCNSIASPNNFDASEFGDELQQVLPRLFSEDEFQVRHAIGNIPLTHDPFAAPLLEALWNGETISGVEIESAILKSPIVRSKIAQGLITLGRRDRKYIAYINQLVNDDNQTIVIVGLEALRDIGDEESIKLLSTFASHSNQKIAEMAIAGVRHYVDYGHNMQYASELWGNIKRNSAVDQSIVDQYERMYRDHKKSVTQ